jgi:DNA/RNA-binding domain of Phe-tRNA-synthetase-like protein
MEVVSFLRELIQDVSESNWEQTDIGYQLVGRDFTVKLRKSNGSSIEVLVETFDGKEIFQASQQSTVEGDEGEISAWLALLYQKVEEKPVRTDAALDAVLRDIRKGRGNK